MGKRSRTKSKSARQQRASNTVAKAASSAKAPAEPPKDVAEDILAYESADSDAAPSVDADSDSSGPDAGSADEELLAPPPADEGAGSDVEVTFDFHDPADRDESAVAGLLTSLCAPAGLDARKVATEVCKQTRVGTVVRVDDNGAPIAVISSLDLCTHRELLAPLRKRIAALGPTVVAALDGKDGSRVALVLSGRVVNLPPQLAPKLFEALIYELQWATEDEPTAELRSMYDVKWFLYMTDVYPTTKTKPARKKVRGKNEELVAFTCVEDEVLLGAATQTVSWDIEGEEAGPDGIKRRKMAMLIKKDRMDEAFEGIKQMFGVVAVDDDDTAMKAE